MTRPSGRKPDEKRSVNIARQFTKHAEGSVLVEFGDTRVICTASVEEGVPRFLRGAGRGDGRDGEQRGGRAVRSVPQNVASLPKS